MTNLSMNTLNLAVSQPRYLRKADLDPQILGQKCCSSLYQPSADRPHEMIPACEDIQ